MSAKVLTTSGPVGVVRPCHLDVAEPWHTRDVPARRLPTTLRCAAPLLLLALAGCTPGATSTDDDEDVVADAPPEATVTIPPVRLTPFCQAMIDLADRLEDDPPDDIRAEIVATYESIEAEVPDAIRDDFDAVLAELRGQQVPRPTDDPDDATTSAPTTSVTGPPVTDDTGATVPQGDPFFDEGYGPEDEPELRLNAYVDFECRSVANNPGPPATQPLTETTTDEG